MLNTKNCSKPSLGHGTSSCSTRSLKSRKCKASNTSTISKYFNKTGPEKASPAASISPYKNVLTEIKPVSLDDSGNDFKTPPAVHCKEPKMAVKDPKPAKRKRTRQALLRNFVEKSFKGLDVNPDHLQLAMALSESSFQAENPDYSTKDDRKMDEFKSVLEKYGLHCGKKKMKAETSNKLIKNNRLEVEKKSKYRFIKPILFIRTEEDRNKLINTKISSTLDRNKSHTNIFEKIDVKTKLFSEELNKYAISKLISLNNSETLADDQFYIKNWHFDRVPKNACGCLLKHWHKIAGRDVSPDRKLNIEDKTKSIVLNANQSSFSISKNDSPAREQKNDCFLLDNNKMPGTNDYNEIEKRKTFKTVFNRSLSPDLFGSDDEMGPNTAPFPTEIIAISDDETHEALIKDELEMAATSPNSFEKTGFSSLNITEIAQQNISKVAENDTDKTINYTLTEFRKKSVSFDEKSASLSQSSTNESIVISDDELNYSCLNSEAPRQESIEISDEEHEIDYEPYEEPAHFNCGSPLAKNEEMGTPGCSFVLKTENVTPMPDYDAMDSPHLMKELDKYGLKPLKRQRGLKLLKHIYESTHPYVDEERPPKKAKISRNLFETNSVEIVGEIVQDGEMLVFEKRESKRIASCRIPLQIVWFNLVSSNPELKEKILLYDPIQLELLHLMIKEQGFKFNIADLLGFLDRKCVTIRTVQSGPRTKKRK